MSTSHAGVQFPTTSWSLVAHAANPDSPEARQAVAKLCEAYWYPLYALIRRKGYPDHEALDATQAYFAHLLEKGTFAAADRKEGRLRTFLATSCKNFLISRYRGQNTEVKGGRKTIVSIDARDAEGRYLHEPADSLTPELIFERTWAVTLLDRVLELLAEEYAAKGNARIFEHLKVVLTEGRRAVRGAEQAALLGMTENAVYQATHRLTARYRAILREQIAETVADPSEVDDEIRSLFEAVRRCS